MDGCWFVMPDGSTRLRSGGGTTSGSSGVIIRDGSYTIELECGHYRQLSIMDYESFNRVPVCVCLLCHAVTDDRVTPYAPKKESSNA